MKTAGRRLPTFKFRLYVAGDAENSAQAVANLYSLCQAQLAGRSEIEIVDVFKDPARALQDGIQMTPTLLKLAPDPPKTIVGNLSRIGPVLRSLGLPAALP